MGDWKCAGNDQTIGQAEMALALIARLTWADNLRGMRLLHFIDHDSARYVLVKGCSPSLALVYRMLSETWLETAG